jgi:hypothetical protein
VADEVEEERTSEAEHGGDQGQAEQPVEVMAIDPPPGSPGRLDGICRDQLA